MFKKRPLIGNLTNYHLWVGLAAYVVLTLIQIGLPESLGSVRQVLTWVQLAGLAALSVLVIINLVKNWE